MKPVQHFSFNVNHHVLSRPPVIAQQGRVPSALLNDYGFSLSVQVESSFFPHISFSCPNYHTDSRPPVIPFS